MEGATKARFKMRLGVVVRNLLAQASATRVKYVVCYESHHAFHLRVVRHFNVVPCSPSIQDFS
jgi:hypothetical protein